MPLKVALNLKDSLYGHLSFGLQKDSEFQQLFDYHLLKMQQSGILAGLHKEWLESPYGNEKATVTTDEVTCKYFERKYTTILLHFFFFLGSLCSWL